MAAMNRVMVAGLIIFIAAIPLVPNIDTKVDVTLAAAVVLLLGVYVQMRSRSWRRTPLDASALALLLAATLATITSVDRTRSFFPSALRGEGWLTFAAYIIAGLAAARLDRSALRPLLVSALAAGSAVGLIALAQYYGLGVNAWLSIDLPVGHLDRMPGTLGNAFFLGGYALLVLPVGVALAARADEPTTCWLSAVGSTLVFAALAASQTRVAWAASIAAGAVLTWVLPRSPRTSRRLVTLAAIFAVTALIMAVTNPHISLGRRAASTFGDKDSSMRERLYVWKHTLPMIAERPLLGWGFGTLAGRFRDVGSPEWLRVFGFRVMGIDTPHTETLHVAYSIGLIGLACYLWVWVVIAASLARALRARGGADWAGAGLTASLLAYAMWLQLGWTHMGPANVFWVLAGAAVALGREDRLESTGRLSPAGRSAGTAR